MKKVLLLSTYPISNPQHGGQKRLRAIYDAYNDNDFTVKAVGIFDQKVYKDHSKDDISLGVKSSTKAKSNPWTGDIISGSAIYNDASVKKAIIRLMNNFKPDIIHVEQPFIYIGLKPLLDELNISPFLIYGSQNLEGPMKREILEGQYLPRSEVDEAVNETERCEYEIVKDCSLLVACTDSDRLAYIKMGAKKEKIVLAQNGIEASHTNDEDIRYWERIMKKHGIEQTFLFIASAHPPSITGFVDAIGKGLGFLKTHQRILIAGSVSDYFKESFNENNLNPYDVTFWLRAYACGRLSESRLGALLKVSDVILLPITEGGGSNLKTAEALIADKKIVTTSHALRSFEWAADLPNIWIADDQESFRKAMVAALDAPKKKRSQKQMEKVQSVLWTNQLREFKERITSL